ncbi:MAG: serine hydrolase, partial [Bacteroidetes bacterium]|nr:serine hydrolase [Bacteroidota bacterium]
CFPAILLSQTENSEDFPIKTIEQLTDSIEKLMEKPKIPGLLLTIITKDTVYYIDGLGMSNIEEDRPVDAFQLFRMGSITKSFASLCILRLVEEGKLSLQDPLANIAPEVSFENQWEETHPVRVVHLLQHTAGFDDMHFAAMYNRGETELPPMEMVKMHQNALYSRWKPGTRHSYSNPGFVILTYLIEKFSGMSYHDYVKQTVLEPLGIKYSNFLSFKDDESKYAMGYALKDGKQEPVPFYPINAGMAGTLNSCGYDMAKWLQFFVNNGSVDSVQVFTPEQLDLMETPSTTLAVQHGITYGYGLANYCSRNDKEVVFHGHNGGIDGFSSTYAYNRDLGIGFAMSNNINGSTGKISDLIVDFLTQDYEPEPVGSQPVTKEEIEPYLGYYLNSSPRNQIFSEFNRPFNGFTIQFENDTVYIKTFMQDPVPMIHMGGLRFRGKNDREPTHVFFLDDGNPVHSQQGSYNEQVSFGWSMTKLGLMIIALILTMSFALVGLIFIILGLRKQFTKEAMQVIVPEFIAGLSFIMGFVSLTGSASNLWEMGTANAWTISFFVFPILGLIAAFVGLGMM